MPPNTKHIVARSSRPSARTRATPGRAWDEELRSVLAWLERSGTRQVREAMLPRYGIPSDKAFGVPVGALQQQAKRLGRSHELAAALWETGWYEARMLASFIDEPARVTPSQMDRWSRDFDSWGICDTVCLHLFDRTPHAWRKVAPWCKHRGEFVRRGGFALLAALALHDREARDEPFAEGLLLVERMATDERNFVKKGVNWALRAIGERSPALHASALELTRRLSASPDATARWVGGDALRKLSSPAVARRLAARSRGTLVKRARVAKT